MVSKIVLFKCLSVLNVAHGFSAIFLGIVAINNTDFYVGLFGMGIWLGGLMLLTGLAGLSSASHVGNRSRLKFFFSCNVILIITMITCNIIIGTVAITHFQYESTVGKDYHNQNNQDHFKAEEEFKARNVAGKTGLTVYGIVMVVITSDVFLNAALVMISRDLFQTATTGSSSRTTTEMSSTDQNCLELAFQSTTSRQQVCDNCNQSFQPPVFFKLPNYADLFPERINNCAGQMSEPMEVCDFQQEPPPAYSPTIQSCFPHSSLPGAIFHGF
ncbi:uncharacterized protein [Acropora muricata]|uniref:uncharacterized protein LOC114957535 n=2 Tax=Acropora TaxID=6127 RepID=UPI001CF23685|nr:uncharacterized protein LOC114957535 [Acropora millepora]